MELLDWGGGYAVVSFVASQPEGSGFNPYSHKYFEKPPFLKRTEKRSKRIEKILPGETVSDFMIVKKATKMTHTVTF